MKGIFLLGLSVSLGGLGLANPVGVRLGYFSGQQFSSGGQRISLQGPTVGADLPFWSGSNGRLRVQFSPSVTFGGSLRRGNDAYATLYRALMKVTGSACGEGFYGGGALGLAGAQGRGTTRVRERVSVVGQVLGGFAIESGPYLEVGYYLGPNPHRGIGIEVGTRF